MTQRDDATLLAAHVGGDPAAFGVLVARHQDRLWSLALRVCGNPDDAADALQDALLSAFRRASGFRGDAQVTTWLHRIVVNACLDLLRRRRAHPTASLPDDPERLAQPSQGQVTLGSSLPSPEDVAVQRSTRDHVTAALATLGADQRAALVLVDMHGYSVDEAARLLGVPPGTVKSRCARGRAKLAPLLGHLLQEAV